MDVAPRTVVSALVGLKVMMKAMVPDQDWRWLADVCNALNRSAKPIKQKGPRMRPTGEIYAAALAEMDRLLATSLTRRIERVGIACPMLAFLAARLFRLKNFTRSRSASTRPTGRSWCPIAGERPRTNHPGSSRCRRA
jgi:hypothetical protein